MVFGAGVLLMANLSTGAGGAIAGDAARVAGDRPELAYLEQVNRWRPPSDPQLVFLLMGQFANADRHAVPRGPPSSKTCAAVSTLS